MLCFFPPFLKNVFFFHFLCSPIRDPKPVQEAVPEPVPAASTGAGAPKDCTGSTTLIHSCQIFILKENAESYQSRGEETQAV